MTWSSWLVHTLQRPIVRQDRERAALHLIDWLGCAHLGQGAEEALPLRAWAARQPAGPIWVCGQASLQAADAARVNGSLGSLYELDDVHREAVVHPGDTVIPAALAVAEREGCSASDLLDALVVGYEAGIRLGLLAGAAHYRHWYSTATTGAFASAVACARLLRLEPLGWQHALGLAGMQAGGVWQCRMEPGVSKQVATGHAAQTGLVAAELASAGVTGPLQILEGDHGWLQATGSAQSGDVARRCLQATAQAPWLMHAVSFKPWPACRHVHPAIACALQAHAQGIAPGEVEALELGTYAVALAFADQPFPDTPHQARFSLQHAVAWALLHGDFWTDASSPDAGLLDASSAALRARVRVALAPAHERQYPQRFGAKLRVRLRNGSEQLFTQDHAWGDPEHPMALDVLRAKARRLLQAGGLPAEVAEGLLEHCLELPVADDLRFWWTRLHAASQSGSVARA